MVRAIISFSEQEIKKLDGVARKHKKSRAQAVREAVDMYVKKHDKDKETWKELVRRTAGIWKHKKIDGLEYERKLRQEWER